MRPTIAMKQRQAKAIATLRDQLKPGDTLQTILRHVSRSGMQRAVSIVHDGRPLDSLFSEATFDRTSQHGGIVIDGCGMDMGFALVYRLGRTLYPQGFGVLSESTPEFPHPVRAETPEQAARMVANGYTFHGRNRDPSGWDTDGGYAFRQQWL